VASALDECAVTIVGVSDFMSSDDRGFTGVVPILPSSGKAF
jgi:hypothetical protein